MEPILKKLSAEAQQFLSLLDSLDYLPPPVKKRLLHEVMHQNQENGVIEVQELRRRAAITLFDYKDMLSVQAQAYLKKDWNIIFGP